VRQRKGFPVNTRRNFLLALIGVPAIVRAQSLMQLRGIVLPTEWHHFGFVERLYVDLHLRKITDQQNEGLSMGEIAADFKRRGMRAMNDAAWNAQSVSTLIERHKFICRQDLLLRAERHLLA
jgi:hypothetical protein